MSTPHVLDELSAYIDGECSEPQRVTRHLQSCPTCAQRHMDLLKLSNHLRAMKRPDVDALFLARVLARVEAEEHPRPWFPAMERRGTLLAMAASVTLVVAASLFMLSYQENAPVSPSYTAVGESLGMDDDAVILAVGALLDEGAWGDPIWAGGDEEPDDPDLTVDELLEALASWTSEESDGDWYNHEDLSSVLEALAEEDAAVLDELTRNHWDKV